MNPQLSPSPRKQTVESAEVEEQTSESDLLHGTSDFNVKLVEANSIEINGIEKDDQHEFIVKIHLKTLEASADEEKMLLIYKLFKKIPVQVAKNVDNSCFIVNESIQLKFKSSLTNLVAYFRDIFHIPIEIVQNNQISGKILSVFKITRFFQAKQVLFKLQVQQTYRLATVCEYCLDRLLNLSKFLLLAISRTSSIIAFH